MSRVDPLARLELMAVFIAGILVGLVAFKQDWAQQRADADHFLGGERAAAAVRDKTSAHQPGSP